MTPREMFELIEDLINEHGFETVQNTINSILEVFEKEER